MSRLLALAAGAFALCLASVDGALVVNSNPTAMNLHGNFERSVGGRISSMSDPGLGPPVDAARMVEVNTIVCASFAGLIEGLSDRPMSDPIAEDTNGFAVSNEAEGFSGELRLAPGMLAKALESKDLCGGDVARLRAVATALGVIDTKPCEIVGGTMCSARAIQDKVAGGLRVIGEQLRSSKDAKSAKALVSLMLNFEAQMLHAGGHSTTGSAGFVEEAGHHWIPCPPYEPCEDVVNSLNNKYPENMKHWVTRGGKIGLVTLNRLEHGPGMHDTAMGVTSGNVIVEDYDGKVKNTLNFFKEGMKDVDVAEESVSLEHGPGPHGGLGGGGAGGSIRSIQDSVTAADYDGKVKNRLNFFKAEQALKMKDVDVAEESAALNGLNNLEHGPGMHDSLYASGRTQGIKASPTQALLDISERVAPNGIAADYWGLSSGMKDVAGDYAEESVSLEHGPGMHDSLYASGRTQGIKASPTQALLDISERVAPDANLSPDTDYEFRLKTKTNLRGRRA